MIDLNTLWIIYYVSGGMMFFLSSMYYLANKLTDTELATDLLIAVIPVLNTIMLVGYLLKLIRVNITTEEPED